MDRVKELEAKIRQLESEKAFLEKVADGIIAVDDNENVIFYNTCFASMWGLDSFNDVSLTLDDIKRQMLQQVDKTHNDYDYSDLSKHLLSFRQNNSCSIYLNDGHILKQENLQQQDALPQTALCWSFRDITSEKALDNKLYQSQQLLKQVLDHTPILLFSTDMDGMIQFIDGQGTQVFGDKKAQLIGQSIFGQSTIETKKQLKRAFEGEFVQLHDVYNSTFDVYSDVTYLPLLDDNSHQIGVVGIILDVSKKHEAERERKQQQQIFNRIIYNAPVLLIATDYQGNINFSRGKLLNLYQMRQGQDEGENFFALYGDHPMSEDVRAALDGKIIRNRHDFTMFENGGYSEVTCAPIRDEDGDVSGIVAIAVDVTDEMQAQLEVERQRQYLDRILSKAPIVMFATDKQGILTFSRGAELRSFGVKQNELVGQNLLSDEAPHPLQDDVRGALKGEVVRNTHEIGDLYLDIYCTPLLDQDANINGMIGVGVNVTDIKRAEEVIEQSQELRKAKEAAEAANIAKTTFISNMSHELRTPLNSIIGFSQFLVNDQTLNSEQQEYVSLITRSSQHLLGLINDILEMSKIETGKVELQEINFDLHELLEGMDSIYHARAVENDLTFELQVLDEIPRYVYGDRNKIRQILINLLSNAVKYTEDGGIVLRTWLDEPEYVDQRDQYHLHFEVEDSGLGIAQHEQKLLFDPFIQTTTGQNSAGGSGLGLVITKQFAQLLGGDVQVDSDVDEGSKFQVDIDVKNAKGMPEPEALTQKRILGIKNNQNYKILVVDDKWENRLMLIRTLERVGFKVREASNGREALQIWKEWSPDLIWMDMRMPIMNGYDATRRIRTTNDGDDVVIIALTASAFEHERQEVLRAGCNDYMSKPFRHDELFEKMAYYLDIEFIYADHDTQEVEGLDQTQVSLSMLVSTLDASLQERLQRAAANYSLDSVLDVTREIETFDANLANQLSQLARDFDFGRILAALDN